MGDFLSATSMFWMNNFCQLSEEINHSGVPYEYGVISKMAENLARLPKFAKIGEKLTFSRSWFKNFREIWPQRKAARIPSK